MAAWARVGVVAALVACWELSTRVLAVDPLVVPPASETAKAIINLLGTPEFRTDLVSTVTRVALAFVIGLVLGVSLGVVSWRVPVLGATIEPYLASMYAVPTLVFYPVMLAVFGLGLPPILAITAPVALIPIALNTTVALRGVEPAVLKMGISVNATRWQVYRKVLFPAAVPLAVPGIRLGFIYSMVGTIAIEFILAQGGLGFRIGFYYSSFQTRPMYALIIVVAILAIVANIGLTRVERRVRRDML